MLNNKSLLYGLGTGLILGAVFLQLMYAVSSVGMPVPMTAVPSPTLQELDQKQVKDIASRYFQVFDKADKLYSQPQVEILIQQKLKEETDKPAVQTAAPAQTRETYVYISKGLVASNVADMLFQSGVITDRKAFEDEMNKKQLNDKIVAGIHAFKGPQELSQVIANIATP